LITADLVTTAWRVLITGGGTAPKISVHGVNEVRQTEIGRAEPLVPEPSAFDVEMATEKL